VQNEDYDAAKALKSEIDRLRSAPKSLKDTLPNWEGDAKFMAFNSKPDSCPWHGQVTKSLF
jgi:hypothetical protein